MQTFLPYASFNDSARCLDRQRLGKQRVEGYQILLTLRGTSKGWRNHPAVRMWLGYEDALVVYTRAMCTEWIERGYKDTLNERLGGTEAETVFPPWLGNSEFHLSHRSNLLRKLPEHYRTFWKDEPDNLPYIWPIR